MTTNRGGHTPPIVERLRELASYGTCCDVDLNETCDEAADTITALLEALDGIAEFGRRHPGHGYSCATLAIEALAKVRGAA